MSQKLLADEEKQELCLMLSVGCDRETVCRYFGITVGDLRNEFFLDRKFKTKLLQAEAKAEFQHMLKLHEASKDPKNWRISVWWLERRAPERFARRAQGALSATQVSKLIEELTTTIVEVVQHQHDRQRLVARLQQITQKLQVESHEAADSTAISVPDVTLQGPDSHN